MSLCCLCEKEIPAGDSVECSAEPYNLNPGGEACRQCAEDAVLQWICSREAAMDAYFNR